MNRKNSRKIYNLDLDTEYANAVEASKSTGVDRTSIVKVCRGYRNMAGGMLWCYADKKNNKVWRV